MAVIIPIDQLEPAFQNAMNHLYGETQLKTVGETVREWHTHFDCYLFHDAFFSWESVAFKNEQQMCWFMLKWS